MQHLAQAPQRWHRLVFPLALAAALNSIGSTAFAAEAAGQIKRMNGEVSVIRAKQTLTATPGFTLEAKDRVLTGKDGSVGFTTTDNSMISLGPNSHMIINQYAFNQQTQDGNIGMRFLKGTFAVVSGLLAKAAPEKTNFSTPTATIGIRGTEFVVRIDVPPEIEAEVLADEGGAL